MILHTAALMALRPNTNFSNQINSIPPVQSPPSKIFRFSLTPNQRHNARTFHEGRIAIVTDVGMGCGGRGSVGREVCSQGGFP